MSEDLIEMLPAMNGHATVPELLDRFSDERSRQAAMVLLTSLADAGLLDDASPPDGDTGPHTPARLSADATAWALRTGYPRRRLALNRQQAAVAVRGEGRLGVAVACLLAAAGVGWVDFGALGKVRAEDTGTGYLDTDVDRPRQEAGLAAIHRSVCTARTGTLPPSRKPDLAVLTDLVVPSPSMIAPLHAEGVPYMLVRMRDGTGVVGPLIVPGRSSCPNCMDLQRTDLGPDVAAAGPAARRPTAARRAGRHSGGRRLRRGAGAADVGLVADRRGHSSTVEHQPGDRHRDRHGDVEAVGAAPRLPLRRGQGGGG
ncbi:hypothetical protein [Kutzneria kofuensis]|uniref:hypothetical protein n=1 Tax=Kutzneria kofuensis TaxID=103725 RepID=UPI0031E71F75